MTVDLLLLSGGMDSIAIAFMIRPKFALTVDYGQRAASAELRSAKVVSETLGIEHHAVIADLRALGSGDMAGTAAHALAPVSEWWPFRNQMLITFAGMKAIQVGADRISIGTLATDGSHLDGTKAFLATMRAVLQEQEGKLELQAPAIGWSAAELIQASKVPSEILAWAHSCHTSEYACGECGGCLKHYRTLEQLGVPPY
jgi:7-cyano-7-deazaguanine synthase